MNSTASNIFRSLVRRRLLDETFWAKVNQDQGLDNHGEEHALATAPATHKNHGHKLFVLVHQVGALISSLRKPLFHAVDKQSHRLFLFLIQANVFPVLCDQVLHQKPSIRTRTLHGQIRIDG
jgi:hypothetical protein